LNYNACCRRNHVVVVVVRTSVNSVICRYFVSFRYWVDVLVLINVIIIVHVNRKTTTQQIITLGGYRQQCHYYLLLLLFLMNGFHMSHEAVPTGEPVLTTFVVAVVLFMVDFTMK